MAKLTIAQIASLFQDFDLELKALEKILYQAHDTSQYLLEAWHEIMLSCLEDPQDLS